MFRTLAEEVAGLVKEFGGSLSGEHGDGRLRGEFIPKVLGEGVYGLLRKVKELWDPSQIFNPGKIVDTPPMDQYLRSPTGVDTPSFDTVFDFSQNQGITRAAEQCNGSGDCRRAAESGGTMCPSYMATRDEKDTTRARANILREVLNGKAHNPFANKSVGEVLDLCLSCKGCSSECPSNVNMSKLKAEWMYQHRKTRWVPSLRSLMFGHYTSMIRLARSAPPLYGLLTRRGAPGVWIKKLIGVSVYRNLPPLAPITLRQWILKDFQPQSGSTDRYVYFFCDEFTDVHDVEVGKKVLLTLDRLGYGVRFVRHVESGRSQISKGLLGTARRLARANVDTFDPLVGMQHPLVGVEPSAILTFRDEYPQLLRGDQQKRAEKLARNVLLIEEFLSREIQEGRIAASAFRSDSLEISYHGHCHQKALSSLTHVKRMFSLAPNCRMQFVPSGCCGMAGSFGYESNHFDLSMKIGELVLFPFIRKLAPGVVISASGTSCRHQIFDGTGRIAIHPIEPFHDALLSQR